MTTFKERWDRLDVLEKGASEGPWGCCYDGSSEWSIGHDSDPQTKRVASIWKYRASEPPNSDFIIHSRNEMRWMLDTLKRYREALKWIEMDTRDPTASAARSGERARKALGEEDT